MRQYQQAMADYGEAIRLNPEAATAFLHMACAYALQDQVEAMLSPLRQALTREPAESLALIPDDDSNFDQVRDDSRAQANWPTFDED